MLDSIFGFGKSKKSRQQQSNGSTNDDSPNDDNSFVFVGHNDPNRGSYLKTIMLNNELIRMGSSAIPQPSNYSLYPSLDSGKNVNNNMYSSTGGGQNLNIQAKCRNCSPIDNVPFSINTNGSSGPGGSIDDEDELEILSILNRVENFVETSKYEFNLENSILRESL